MTVGTRIAPRTVCTASSWSRMGRVTHSSHVTGRMWSSPSISKPVATLVAIMQKASCGVRTLIACQLRFSTSTIVLFRMSDIKLELGHWGDVGLGYWDMPFPTSPYPHHPIHPFPVFPVFVVC